MSPKKKTEKKKSANSGFGPLKIIGTLIVILAVLALVFSSVLPGNSGSNNRFVFGTYGDKEIVFNPSNEFGQAIKDAMNYDSIGVESDSPYFELMRLMTWQQTYESFVVDTAIEYHVEASGYDVSSRAVDRMIIDYGPWRTNGVFDESLYREASTTYKEDVRSRFKKQLAIEAWGTDTMVAKYRSAAQVDFLSEMNRNVAAYDMVSIPYADFPEEDVAAYAAENSGLFASLPVSRISVDTEETANSVLAMIEEQKSDIGSFGNIAGEYSEDAYGEYGGEMGSIARYRLAELIGSENTDTVFAASEGDIVGPLDTRYGWMIFKVDGPQEVASTGADLTEVRNYMMSNEVGLIEDSLLAVAEQIQVKVLAGADFAEAAAEAGYVVITTGAFPVNFGGDSIVGTSPDNVGIAELSGASESEAFWKAITSLNKVGQVSTPVVMSSSIALFSLESETENEELPYWTEQVNYDANQKTEADFRAAVLGDDNEFFKDSFTETYSSLVEG